MGLSKSALGCPGANEIGVGQGTAGLGEQLMWRKWLADHDRAFRALLLALAALNGWTAYTIRSEHPIMALLNSAMAVLIVLGVSLIGDRRDGNKD